MLYELTVSNGVINLYHDNYFAPHHVLVGIQTVSGNPNTSNFLFSPCMLDFTANIKKGLIYFHRHRVRNKI